MIIYEIVACIVISRRDYILVEILLNAHEFYPVGITPARSNCNGFLLKSRDVQSGKLQYIKKRLCQSFKL